MVAAVDGGVAGGLFGASAAFLIGISQEEESPPQGMLLPIVGVPVALGIVYAWSAYDGYHNARACHALRVSARAQPVQQQ